ncbi:MAG: hypothetical protein AAFV53_27310, partial [Myxococcota bacterium]
MRITSSPLMGLLGLTSLAMLSPPAKASTCGDGLVETGEECDDDNLDLGDGCDDVCEIEEGWNCREADLSEAFTDSYPDGLAPLWSLSSDNLTLSQTRDSEPAFYGTHIDASSIEFTIRVGTTTQDDFIGWVVGFKDGDAESEDANYILFDWKQRSQSGLGTFARRGLAMSAVDGEA